MAHLKDLIDIFLQPGEYFVGDSTFKIRTMLGSCVSMTLWHPTKRIGAMSHFLLPKRSYIETEIKSLDARYGDEALVLMLSELEQAGVPSSQCQGKIFGGGNMFPGHYSLGAMKIGQKNGDAARLLLQDNGIKIVSESLFGIGHRQIIFDVSTGSVWSRQVKLPT